ncbi:hypothetical protein EWH21_06800 [Pseudomonas sp. REST10]|nr:hypothetical protein EWH21_06800 [Pseudomonas sp. REST10]
MQASGSRLSLPVSLTQKRAGEPPRCWPASPTKWSPSCSRPRRRARRGVELSIQGCSRLAPLSHSWERGWGRGLKRPQNCRCPPSRGRGD